MIQSSERPFVLFFRFTMAWTFLYAASHQIFDPNWSVAGFLSHTKTFHDIYAPLTAPSVSKVVTFLVGYGHLLIGLSLLVGFMVRISASFGILLMLMYWTAHMNFPYIDDANNFLLDFHIVYAGVLAWLIVKQAGHVWGIDGWLETSSFLEKYPTLRPLIA